MKQDEHTLDLFGAGHTQRGDSIIPRAPSGEALAVDGMERAADHADAVSEGWRDRALRWVALYAHRHPTFRCEQVRAHAESLGFSHPPDNRAWGYVMRRAQQMGYVEFVEYQPAQTARVHKTVVALWHSLLCARP